jgi:DNA phosphorothioation-dependent restriction protein DptG
VRAGTLDDEIKKTVKPDVHIFTSAKMDWVHLTSEKERVVPVMEEYYHRTQVWRKDALERFDVLEQKIDAADKAEEGADKGKEESKIYEVSKIKGRLEALMERWIDGSPR